MAFGRIPIRAATANKVRRNIINPPALYKPQIANPIRTTHHTIVSAPWISLNYPEIFAGWVIENLALYRSYTSSQIKDGPDPPD